MEFDINNLHNMLQDSANLATTLVGLNSLKSCMQNFLKDKKKSDKFLLHEDQRLLIFNAVDAVRNALSSTEQFIKLCERADHNNRIPNTYLSSLWETAATQLQQIDIPEMLNFANIAMYKSQFWNDPLLFKNASDHIISQMAIKKVTKSYKELQNYLIKI